MELQLDLQLVLMELQLNLQLVLFLLNFELNMGPRTPISFLLSVPLKKTPLCPSLHDLVFLCF
jgi:hypothetical protein